MGEQFVAFELIRIVENNGTILELTNFLYIRNVVSTYGVCQLLKNLSHRIFFIEMPPNIPLTNGSQT